MSRTFSGEEFCRTASVKDIEYLSTCQNSHFPSITAPMKAAGQEANQSAAWETRAQSHASSFLPDNFQPQGRDMQFAGTFINRMKEMRY
jgi:hypothetical protein